MRDSEIADADRTSLAPFLQRFESAPALPPLPHRKMNQVQIYIIHLELAQAGVERPLRITVIAIPQFGGDENSFPGNAAHPDGGAHALFVAVRRRGIDM